MGSEMCIRDRNQGHAAFLSETGADRFAVLEAAVVQHHLGAIAPGCLLYTSDAADERSSVDLGGRRIIKKKNRGELCTNVS